MRPSEDPSHATGRAGRIRIALQGSGETARATANA
jgi:hypothetical protein